MSKSLDRKLDALLGEMRGVNRQYEEATQAKSADGGRRAAAIDGQREIAQKAAAVDDAKLGEEVKKSNKAGLEARLDKLTRLMAENRSPSKAALIGNGKAALTASRLKNNATVKAHPALRASFRNYQGGEFLNAYGAAKGYLTDLFDPEVLQAGKAKLAEFAGYMDKPDLSAGLISISGKATLGTTGATGGYVLPNNLVDSVIKPNVQMAIYPSMGVRVVNGVAVRGVDQPYRTGSPTRATFADWGTTKANINEAYGSYTATLGTLASIYDVGKQYLRFSAGAAEQDVMDEITKAFALAENYAVIAGPGTGSATPGVSDPTYGLYTALLAGALTYTTSHGSPSNSTLVGSLATAITQGQAALGLRARTATSWVVDPTTYFTALAQGTDTAGFFIDPAGGPSAVRMNASGQLTFWSMPIFYDQNLGTNAATKIIIGGEWDALKLYRGIEFRIDSSDVAGTRWDQNLVGFRGEEEIAIHAGSAVSVGAFQLITTAIA